MSTTASHSAVAADTVSSPAADGGAQPVVQQSKSSMMVPDETESDTDESDDDDGGGAPRGQETANAEVFSHVASGATLTEQQQHDNRDDDNHGDSPIEIAFEDDAPDSSDDGAVGVVAPMDDSPPFIESSDDGVAAVVPMMGSVEPDAPNSSDDEFAVAPAAPAAAADDNEFSFQHQFASSPDGARSAPAVPVQPTVASGRPPPSPNAGGAMKASPRFRAEVSPPQLAAVPAVQGFPDEPGLSSQHSLSIGDMRQNSSQLEVKPGALASSHNASLGADVSVSGTSAGGSMNQPGADGWVVSHDNAKRKSPANSFAKSPGASYTTMAGAPLSAMTDSVVPPGSQLGISSMTEPDDDSWRRRTELTNHAMQSRLNANHTVAVAAANSGPLPTGLPPRAPPTMTSPNEASPATNANQQPSDEWDAANRQHEVDTAADADRTAEAPPLNISWDEAYEALREQTAAWQQYVPSLKRISPAAEKTGFLAMCWRCWHHEIEEGTPVFAERDFVLALQFVPLEHSNMIHRRILLTIYRLLVRPRREAPDPLTIGREWGALGFQGNNPGTDLRSTGLFGLLQLLYLVDYTPQFAAAMFEMCSSRLQEVPLALVSLNMSGLTMTALKDKVLHDEIVGRSKNADSTPQPSFMRRKEGTYVAQVMNEHFLGLMHMFFDKWRAVPQRRFTDFDGVRKALLKPALSDVKAVFKASAAVKDTFSREKNRDRREERVKKELSDASGGGALRFSEF
jgi:hypothetical protein